MSLLGSFSKKSKLKSAIKQTHSARKSEGNKADQLFSRAYEDFALAVEKDLLLAESLYNWGLALLSQAKTKSDDEAVQLFIDAIEKFSFCSTIDPNYLAAAIDSGVAFMDLARIKNVSANDDLYAKAQDQFSKANAIQAGTASYNLACIYGLRRDEEGCRKALEDSRDHGALPSEEAILNDPDLQNVKYYPWFADFMESLKPEPEPEPEEEVTEVSDESEGQVASEVVTEEKSEEAAIEVEPVEQSEGVALDAVTESTATNDVSSTDSEVIVTPADEKPKAE